MLHILINAYACSPSRGSEPGMAWNWILNLSKTCKLYVITEGEWKDEIENYLKINKLNDQIKFYYNSVSNDIREMCWNQGDWKFYYYYHLWQKNTLKIANEIISTEKIDLIHQLNMVGYREPGLLWKIQGKPLVWGPIGGFGGIPSSYLGLFSRRSRIKQQLKQFINSWQVFSPYIKKAVKSSDALVACNTNAKIALEAIVKRYVPIISEVGAKPFHQKIDKDFTSKTLKVAWVGKNDERKALPIAMEIFKQLKHENIELNIYGINKKEVPYEEHKNIVFHGWLPYDRVQEEFKNCHILLFTSLFEATGTAVLEALSYGLPVLCHNTCGQGDIINETCGATVKMKGVEHSIQMFSKLLLKFHQDRDHLKSLSNGAINRVKEISWEENCNKMLKIYNTLIENRKLLTRN